MQAGGTLLGSTNFRDMLIAFQKEKHFSEKIYVLTMFVSERVLSVIGVFQRGCWCVSERVLVCFRVGVGVFQRGG